jgi:multifunctional 2-oxoglutarate metabolism enzyme
VVLETTTQVVMPRMGDSVNEGTILEWKKAEGDRVSADETLVEISTDKVDAEVPSPVSGTLVRIHAAEGETVGVGALLAEIAVGANGGSPEVQAGPATAADAPAAGAGNGSAANAPAAPADPPPPGADGARVGTIVDIVTPAAGESVSEGTILDWTVAVGDSVRAGDTVVEISTDKVDVELPAPAAGVISEILAAEGDTVTVGQVIGRITSGGTAPAPPAVDEAPTQTDAPPPPQPQTGAPPPQPDVALARSEPAHASPVARRAAAALDVDLGSLAGSGPAGRIVKVDVLDAAAHRERGAPERTGGAVTVMKGAAAMLARYMDESRTVPTATSFRTIAVTALDGRRRQLKAAGAKVSYTHLIAYAIVRAATEHPVMADHFAEVDGRPARVRDAGVNLGLAVDVERKDGSRTLMVPVILDAGSKRFDQFLAAYDALVEKARTNTLVADDLAGANISLTNPGGLGTAASVPRLMPGQGTIVATGQIAFPPGLAAIGEQIGAEKVMTLTSTYDHRVIQGAESGRFLARVEALLDGADGFYAEIFTTLGLEARALASPSAPAAPAPAASPAARPSDELLQAAATANALVRSLRTHGHLAASLDPLGSAPQGDPALEPAAIGLTPELMAQIPSKLLHVFVPGETLAESFPHLRDTYCGTIAYQLEHIASHQQRRWLREKIEGGVFHTPMSEDEQRALLIRLIEVDALERFMHRAYLGQHQFSIEGVDMTVPMLDALIQMSAADGAREVVIGMAHRGRLNVLAHNLGRPYKTIFAEFEGASTLGAVTTIPQGGTGDVKYHHGAQGSYRLPDGESIQVNLESNPSHLEFVAPVVMGATRAAQSSHVGPRSTTDTSSAVSIVIHGDAAFPAQGVVAETLNLQDLDGYGVGGTLHLITNNQMGFTTDPDDARSTRWASDLAKGFDIPIIHVNADDVEACMSAVRLAFAYRDRWGHDVLIDLIGYRRYGHNESDEPAYTQPEMYAQIKDHKRVCELWADELIRRGVVSAADVERAQQAAWDQLTRSLEELRAQIAQLRESGAAGPHTEEYHLDRSASPEVDTTVAVEQLREFNEDLLRVPEQFTVHPKLVRQLERRRGALETEIDWAHAESLAFSSLLADGTPIRLTGQDTERGTFSQRHLVLHDASNGQTYCPIQQLSSSTAPFELHNSPLSEVGCLGFEYGYSQESPETVVLWEAQFGDFANSAQVIIDQFIISGLAKWGQTSRLTLLLPHGYEGSGPEHSSARLERFLSLAAEGNLRVANPTTPAQYFHLLRRQAKIVKQRPLIVMTPKSLLRLPQATSTLADLADGQLHPVLAEPGVDEQHVTRLILCTGKIYYDLVGHADRAGAQQIAVGRVELLYPFPENELLALFARYPNLREIAWVQEEPRNMGARAFMGPRLLQIMPAGLHYGYVGRPERASPGEGYPAAHAAEQSRIVGTALDLSVALSPYPVKTPGER